MPNSLLDAAEAAVVAHFATQLAGRLGEPTPAGVPTRSSTNSHSSGHVYSDASSC